MDSKIDYNNYKADSLLNDAYFLESEQHPTPESIMFWDKLAQLRVIFYIFSVMFLNPICLNKK